MYFSSVILKTNCDYKVNLDTNLCLITHMDCTCVRMNLSVQSCGKSSFYLLR